MAHSRVGTWRAGMTTLCAAGALLAGAPLQAQQSSPQSAQLEEIVVTARRREEALQTAPVAVTAFSAATLDRLNVQEVRAIQNLAPNLVIDQQPSSSTMGSAHIRGIGESNTTLTAEPGVGMYLDGVYLARTVAQVFDLVELERIEVLRGPQGTLFGRNTIGGAVQLVSKRPTEAFGIEEKAGYGSYRDLYSKTTVNTGLIGDMPVKAAITFLHRERHGYVDNTLTKPSDDPGAINANSVWATLQARPGDALTLDYSFDLNHRRVVPVFFQMTNATPDVARYFGASAQFGGAAFQLSPERLGRVQRDLFQGANTSVERTQGHNLTISYEVSPALTVKSITGYRKYTSDDFLGDSTQGDLRGVLLDPVTFAPSVGKVVPFEGFQNPHDQKQWSEELQLLGESGRFTYVGGLYFFKEKVAETLTQYITFVLPGGQAGLNLQPTSNYSGSARALAAFGQVSWRPPVLDDRLSLTGGLRATRDSKTIHIADSNSGVPSPQVNGKRSFSNVSWLTSADYRLTDDVMAYARVSSGYRSGGFNPRASGTANSYGPEHLISYEAGIKSEWFDKRLRANLSGFHSDYKDLQSVQFVAGSGGASTIIVNAGKAEYNGYELELTAVPVAGLVFDGSLGYTSPRYKSFPYRDPATDRVIDIAQLAVFGNVARLTTHFGAQYTLPPLPFGELSLRLDYSYHSQRRFHPNPLQAPFNEQIGDPGQHNLDGRITLSSVSAGPTEVEISGWGRNLTNAVHRVWGIDFGALGFGGVLFGMPRTFGVVVKIKY